MAIKKVVKPAPGKALVKWDEKFAGLAKAATKGLDLPTAKFISLKSGRMTFGGAAVPNNELRAVVIGAVHENKYYDPEIPFDPTEAQAPICYAFGVEKEEMAPLDTVPDKQCDFCAQCPQNEWASAKTGKGKACKNVMRLALIAESDLEDLGSAEIVYLNVPVMSVKNWVVYAKKTVADTVKRPYWAVVTNIRVEPDNASQFRVVFELAEMIEDSELFEPLEDLWNKTMDGIDFPYVQRERTEVKPKAPVRKNKFAAKR